MLRGRIRVHMDRLRASSRPSTSAPRAQRRSSAASSRPRHARASRRPGAAEPRTRRPRLVSASARPLRDQRRGDPRATPRRGACTARALPMPHERIASEMNAHFLSCCRPGSPSCPAARSPAVGRGSRRLSRCPRSLVRRRDHRELQCDERIRQVVGQDRARGRGASWAREGRRDELQQRPQLGSRRAAAGSTARRDPPSPVRVGDAHALTPRASPVPGR